MTISLSLYTPSPPLLPLSLSLNNPIIYHPHIYISICLSLSPQNFASPYLLVAWQYETIYYQSILSISLHTYILYPLYSDLLAILLSTSFLSILFNPASIGSDHYPQICILHSDLSISSLIISF